MQTYPERVFHTTVPRGILCSFEEVHFQGGANSARESELETLCICSNLVITGCGKDGPNLASVHPGLPIHRKRSMDRDCQWINRSGVKGSQRAEWWTPLCFQVEAHHFRSSLHDTVNRQQRWGRPACESTSPESESRSLHSAAQSYPDRDCIQ